MPVNLKKVDEIFSLMDKAGSLAVRGAISHEDREVITRVLREEAMQYFTKELAATVPAPEKPAPPVKK